jgi:tetratricopeptide (TPR) repeat protein
MPAKICAATLALTMSVCATTASAQMENFVQAVAQLANASAQPQEARTNAIRVAADRMADALSEWDRRIALLEQDADRHIERSVAYRLRGRLDDAVREFDATLVQHPNSSDVHLLRALTLESMQRADDAARGFAAAWAAEPGSLLKAYYVATRPAVNVADRERARARLTDVYRQGSLKRSPPFLVLDAIPDNLLRAPVVAAGDTAQAFALLAAGHFNEAVIALRQPTRLDDADTPLSHFLRAQQDERIGEVASARSHYQQALTGALLGRGAIYVAVARLAQVEGDPSAAVEALTQAVALNPNEPYFRKELALAHASEGRVDEAFFEMIAALLIAPGDATTHAAIGQLFLDAGRDDEAVRALTRALELNPDAFEARYGLATALTRLGNTAEATRQLAQFELARREAQDRRRRDIANDVEPSTQHPGAPARGAVR